MSGLGLRISKISPRPSVGRFMMSKFSGKANEGEAQESEGEACCDLGGGTRQISWDRDPGTQPVCRPQPCFCPCLLLCLLPHPPQSGPVLQITSLPGAEEEFRGEGRGQRPGELLPGSANLSLLPRVFLSLSLILPSSLEPWLLQSSENPPMRFLVSSVWPYL